VNQGNERRADVVILTALGLELDAVLRVDAGAVPGSSWETSSGPSGLPVAFRSFLVERGRPLRIAAAVAPAMGATAALSTLLPLVAELRPSCVASCGVCAGRPGKVNLGDVVAADRLYYHDTGKQLADEVQQDLTTYDQRDDWKIALERMAKDAAARFGGEPWFQARPISAEWREHRALVALRDGVAEPWKAVDGVLAPGEWQRIVAALRERKLLAATGRELTDEGRRFVDGLLFDHMNALPDLSPTGALHPFRLHVAPIASGMQVIEDQRIWDSVSKAMRKTLGLEMEVAAIGELAQRQRPRLDWVVMKGVMDFANQGRDDHFKEFAARASAECLLWFLRGHVSTELTAGFDDLLTPGTLPLPARDPAPSLLLNARYAVVPWHDAGRAEILAGLDAWADDAARGVALRLLHAEGGVGKTRLAIEWVRRRRGRHDAAGFLVRNPDERWLERLCGLGAPVILVLDYAESRGDLVTVLERIAAYAASGGPRRIRVLLLARNDGDWWKALLQQQPQVQALQDREPVKLSPLATTAIERDAVFAEAARVFAAVRRRPPVTRPPVALEDARFQRVLYVHMAAFVATELARPDGPDGDDAPDDDAPDGDDAPEASDAGAAPSGEATLDAGLLMNEILAHEERFWMREASDRAGTAIAVPLARQLVAAATLRGGLRTRDEARALCVRLEERPRTREDDALIALLHDIYDQGSAYLPGLEPDLVGEGMVLRVASPPDGAGEPAGDRWIERVLVPGDEARALTAAFTVLGRASAMNQGAVRPWIAGLLGTELAARAVLALRAAEAVGRRTASSALGDLLAETLERAGTLAIALELAREDIPYATVSLGRVAEWQSRIRLAHGPGADDAEARDARAGLLLEHGMRLSDVGQREEALRPTQEAVALYRGLAARDPAGFQARLAYSLDRLGVRSHELGQTAPALAALREAVELRRAAATQNAEGSQRDLANTLTDISVVLSAAGQREPALVAAQEAVELFRALAQRDPEGFRSELPTSLLSLGIRLHEVGRLAESLAVIREAVELHRPLAAKNPDVFEPQLAMSLTNLSVMLGELGDPEAALAASREAVELYRPLAARNADAFVPHLALALLNLGAKLTELSHHEHALAARSEAVSLYRALAAETPDAFEPLLAGALSGLSHAQSERGDREAAIASAREAVDMYRALVARSPDAFQPALAESLTNLAKAQREVGQLEPALATARETLELHRVLATNNPATFQPDVAMSLNNLAAAFNALGHREQALAAAREAAELRRALADRQPDAFQPGLALTLTNLGVMAAELGHYEEALAAMRDSVEIHRALAARSADAFRDELASSLSNLGTLWTQLGHNELALATTREAVEIHRALAANRPGVLDPDLASSLHNLGNALGALGQREPAIAAAREAVDLRRALATRHPDVFRADLAMSLYCLGLRLSEGGQREPAIAVTSEAVEIYRALVASHAELFQPHLASTLSLLGLLLGELGQRESALAAARDAVEICRALATHYPDQFQPMLAQSLANLDALQHGPGGSTAAGPHGAGDGARRDRSAGAPD
jgi:tetratricopeptide (TPR) repeat protein/nucleoside phosphorylase